MKAQLNAFGDTTTTATTTTTMTTTSSRLRLFPEGPRTQIMGLQGPNIINIKVSGP